LHAGHVRVISATADHHEERSVGLGYDGKLFILAIDDLAGTDTSLTAGEGAGAERSDRAREARQLVFDGLQRACDRVAIPRRQVAILVDEQLGRDVARAVQEHGITLALAVGRADQDVFDLADGEDFGAHITDVDPDLVAVAVRWNAGDAPDVKRTQARRLATLGAWLHQTGRSLLFELRVPATEEELAQVDGDAARYAAERRPAATRRAIAEIRDLGVDADVWAVEGAMDRADADALGALVRDEGRDQVGALVLARDEQVTVDQAFQQAAALDAYQGFVIGRPLWSSAIVAHLAGDLGRDEAADRIADGYARVIDLYTTAETA
jgi:myo-inositol catabolism protein IolC